ncbi:radial spoke head 10 homolog B isoform X1 [Danio rerio]|uniref:Radial spoke head 10 homolog B isoform X1 n=1 Tax=Danio rerio TaxID=7955 RepID=A0AC58GW87_DANRE
MRWIDLDQQYSGQWINGTQEGKGTHTWFRKRAPSSQYPRMNEYTGDFVQAMRHGQGQFLYASGALYCGQWKYDKKHGQGRYIFENGRVYEGEFSKDCMAEFPAFTPGLSGITTPFPDENDSSKGASQSSSNASPLGSDMVLNIQTLLNRVSEAHREQEFKQVEFAVLRHMGLLREIYSFYSSLGHEQSLDKIFPLTHLQFSRFLLDCRVHQHGVTLAQIYRLINVHSPFTAILPRECISYIIIIAYHICHKDIECSNNILAACFSKLMKQNIIPNAKSVKGHLFCHPVHAAVALNYSDKCWEIYQALCEAHSVFTVRQLVLMLKDLCLYDNELTVSKLIRTLSVDSPAIHDGTYSNLDLEMSFLEFFEALLGCAELKGQKIQSYDESQTDASLQDHISSLSKEKEQRQSPVLAYQETELNDWMQKTQQFFNQTFLPAYELKVKVEEETFRLRNNTTTRYTEQLELKEKQEQDADGNELSPVTTTSVTAIH